MVERAAWDGEAAGSNPAIPTNIIVVSEANNKRKTYTAILKAAYFHQKKKMSVRVRLCEPRSQIVQ